MDRYFEDFKVGDAYRHALGHTATITDNYSACTLRRGHGPEVRSVKPAWDR